MWDNQDVSSMRNRRRRNSVESEQWPRTMRGFPPTDQPNDVMDTQSPGSDGLKMIRTFRRARPPSE